ncbi:MAG TPA: HPr kinase/phosphatase C-terminal domain-containing protein [Stellaceae bacterium]|nr:HPr kinase/phosphatase C-terminal domain-containing protein [Stellaceae bacterium]
MDEPLLVHATAVAIGGLAVLLRGDSGSGKSDLALRLIDAGARLVSDDQCELRRAGDAVLVRAPEPIRGLFEIRGVGIVTLPALADIPLALAVDLVPPDRVERLPLGRKERFLGFDVPVIALAPFEASAPSKLRAALRTLSAPPDAGGIAN